MPGWISRVTSWLRPSHEWLAKLTAWTFWNVFFSFLYQHYISPLYPQNSKEILREKTLAIHMRVRDCKPIIIYTISLSFPLHLPLQLQILETFLAQTLTSPNMIAKWSFHTSGKYWKKPSIGGCNLEQIVGSR